MCTFPEHNKKPSAISHTTVKPAVKKYDAKQRTPISFRTAIVKSVPDTHNTPCPIPELCKPYTAKRLNRPVQLYVGSKLPVAIRTNPVFTYAPRIHRPEFAITRAMDPTHTETRYNINNVSKLTAIKNKAGGGAGISRSKTYMVIKTVSQHLPSAEQYTEPPNKCENYQEISADLNSSERWCNEADRRSSIGSDPLICIKNSSNDDNDDKQMHLENCSDDDNDDGGSYCYTIQL